MPAQTLSSNWWAQQQKIDASRHCKATELKAYYAGPGPSQNDGALYRRGLQDPDAERNIDQTAEWVAGLLKDKKRLQQRIDEQSCGLAAKVRAENEKEAEAASPQKKRVGGLFSPNKKDKRDKEFEASEWMVDARVIVTDKKQGQLYQGRIDVVDAVDGQVHVHYDDGLTEWRAWQDHGIQFAPGDPVSSQWIKAHLMKKPVGTSVWAKLKNLVLGQHEAAVKPTSAKLPNADSDDVINSSNWWSKSPVVASRRFQRRPTGHSLPAAIARLVTKGLNIQSIDMSHQQLGERQAVSLANAIAGKLVTDLNIRGNFFGDLGAQVVAHSILARAVDLTKVNLGDCGVGIPGAMHVCKQAKCGTLILDGNTINEHDHRCDGDAWSHTEQPVHGMETLSLIIGANTNITTLSLSNNRLGNEACHYLHMGLQHNTALQYFDLSNNFVMDAGAEHLSKLLQVREFRLGHLNLANNKIGDVGLRHLQSRLHGNVYCFMINIDTNLTSAVARDAFQQIMCTKVQTVATKKFNSKRPVRKTVVQQCRYELTPTQKTMGTKVPTALDDFAEKDIRQIKQMSQIPSQASLYKYGDPF